jgi:hypothetical protein
VKPFLPVLRADTLLMPEKLLMPLSGNQDGGPRHTAAAEADGIYQSRVLARWLSCIPSGRRGESSSAWRLGSCA